jgi:PAS domain S-box-containing protein
MDEPLTAVPDSDGRKAPGGRARKRVRLAADGEPGAEPRAEVEALRARVAELEASQAILDRVSDGFLAIDREGWFVYSNAAAERFLGLARAALRERPAWEILGERVGSIFEAALRRAMEEQVPVRAEDYLPGAGLWFSLHAHPSPDGLSVYLEEVSERKAAEQERERLAGELMAERALLNEVLQQMPAGVTIAEAPSGRILTRNRVGAKLLGLPASTAEGGEEGEAGPPGFHPDGRPYAPEEWPLARAVREGEVISGEEIDLQLESGARRTISVNAAPVRDSRGRILVGVAAFRDVTERKRRLAIDRLMRRVSEVLTSSLDYGSTVQSVAQLCAGSLAEYCIVHIEEEGAIRAVGVAHTDASQEAVLRGMLRLLPIDPEGAHPVLAAIRTGEPQLLRQISDPLLARLGYEPEQYRVMREMRLSSALVVPLRARGRTLGALSLARTPDHPPYGPADLAVVEEVARRAAMAVDNARLFRGAQREAKAREDLLGLVSHDLRNSLNASFLQTEVLLELVRSVEGWPGQRQVEAVRRSLAHMQTLVQDLLDVESLESGQLSLRIVPLDLASLADEVEDMFGPLARERSVSLRVDLASAPPAVRADRVRLIQVVSNLVSNALRFTPAGGTITVAAERFGERVRFRVADTGVGIPAADRPRVFERFWRGDHSQAGTGLGLAIARGLVRAQGGEIWMESEVGRGTVFHFTLPLADAPAEP